ncbi:MAG: general secretion pathway protein GspK [Deltaproteobacteria bacterium]
MIICLWTLFLLSVFAVILSSNVRQKLVLVQHLDERARLRYIGDAGVKRGIAELRKMEIKSYVALNESWAINPGLFKDVDIGSGKFSVCYNYGDEESGVMQTRYGVIDEERKLNINKCEPQVLRRLFQIALDIDETQAAELAACIVDWRDSDSQASMPGGAENSYYTNLQYPYASKDAFLEVLDEVFLIKGFNDCTFQKIKDYITIYGEGRVNINTASRPVLTAVGLSGSIIDKIMAFRRGKDKTEATPDDNFFASSSEIVPRLSQEWDLSDSEIAQLSMVSERYLTTNSDNFMIKVLSRIAGRSNMKETLCVFNRSGKKILYWRE